MGSLNAFLIEMNRFHHQITKQISFNVRSTTTTTSAIIIATTTKYWKFKQMRNVPYERWINTFSIWFVLRNFSPRILCADWVMFRLHNDHDEFREKKATAISLYSGSRFRWINRTCWFFNFKIAINSQYTAHIPYTVWHTAYITFTQYPYCSVYL